MIRGTCILGVNGKDFDVPLTGGDFLLIPAPETYSLRSSADIPITSILTITTPEDFHRTRLITAGGGGLQTALMAGCIEFGTNESSWLVKELPPVLYLSASAPDTPPWFQTTLQFMTAELATDKPGAPLVVDRLAEVLFVQALRSQIGIADRDDYTGWLRALADPQIGESLRLIHLDPSRTWSVPELAQNVSMSRSAFAARFKQLVGETPIDHLTRWRMVKAAGLLTSDESMKLCSIAQSVGYDTSSAFGKAFRRVMGITPAEYKAAQQAAASTN
jgi:AraC-like DNA-binding protein